MTTSTKSFQTPQVDNTSESNIPNTAGSLFYNTEADELRYKNNDGDVITIQVSITDDSSSNAVVYPVWTIGPGNNPFNVSTSGSLGGISWNPALATFMIGNPDILPHIATNQVLYNRQFGALSLSFTGVDYPAFYADHEGISMGLGLNGPGNKEAWMVDSAYSDAGNTEIAMRFFMINSENICGIDALSTDRSTNLPIKFGNENAPTILAGLPINVNSSSISPNTYLGTDGSNNLISIATNTPIAQQLWVNAASGNDSNSGTNINSALASYEAARLLAVASASPTNEYLINIIGDQSITGDFVISPYITVDGHNSGTITATGDIIIDNSLLTLSNQTPTIKNCSFNIRTIDIEFDTGVNNFVQLLNCDFPSINPSYGALVSSNDTNTQPNGLIIIGKPSTLFPSEFSVEDASLELVNLTMITNISLGSSGTAPTSLALVNVQGANTISASSSFGGSSDIQLINSQAQNVTLNDSSTTVFTDILSLNSKNLTLSGGATSSQITYNTDCSAQNVSTLLYVPLNYTPASPSSKVRSDSILSHLNGIDSALNSLKVIWTEISSTSQSMSANNGYVANNASLVTLTLPSSCAFGTVIQVDGKGTGGWKIAQNSGQKIYYQGASTTTGTSGHLDSTNARACVTLRCITADTEWIVETTTGAITLV